MDYFDYLEPETGDFDVEEFLEQSQEDQKQRLEEELERIQDQLEQRERLHDEIIKELKSKRDWYLQRHAGVQYTREIGCEGVEAGGQAFVLRASQRETAALAGHAGTGT